MSFPFVLVFTLALAAATPGAGQRSSTEPKRALLLNGWVDPDIPGNAGVPIVVAVAEPGDVEAPGAISVRRPLPAGTVVRYDEGSVLERYRWEFLGLSAVLLLQTALMLKVLIERSGRRRAQHALAERVRFLRLVVDFSSSALDYSPVLVDRWIEGWLRRLGEFLGVDRASLLERSEPEGGFRFLHRWSAESAESMEPPLPPGIEELPWTAAALQRGEIVRVDRLADLPADAEVDRQTCQRAGVKSFLAAPLPARNGMMGVFTLTTLRAEHLWPEEVIAHLRLMADIFASALVLKRTETARQAGEGLNRALLASLSAPTAVLDREGAILQVNGPWKALGRQDGATYLPWAPAGVNYLEVCRRAEATGNGRVHDLVVGVRSVLDGTRREFRIKQHSSVANSERSLELIVASLKLPEGGAVVTQIDLTDRERADREVQELRHAMAHFSRVASLAELAGSLAHELNQPLTAILNNVQAAKRFLAAGDTLGVELQEILTDIEEDDRRAGEIIRRLRALIRKDGVEYQSASLNDLAGGVAALLAPDLRLRHVAVQLELDPALPAVRADRIHLQQVILNLMMNGVDAMQHTSPDKVRLVIRTWRPNDQSVALSVRDNGTGIREDPKDRIFEPFYTTKKEGLGMGLAICRSIADAHGGEIRAANNPDGGATVELILPLRGSEAP